MGDFKSKETGKEVGGAILGLAVGGAQTYALRTYVDKPAEPWFGAGTSYAGLGQPSALLGLGLGVVETVGGVYCWKKEKLSKPIAMAIMALGLTSLAGGAYSAFKPVTIAERARVGAPQRVPMAQFTPAMQQAAAAQGIRVVPTAVEPSGIVVVDRNK
jgi:hypothetical protein